MVFCEGRWGGLFRPAPQRGTYLPEASNTISALFIGFCGAHMLIFWDHESAFMRVISALFVVNGWGSALFHAYSTGDFGAVDADSMLFTVWLIMGFILEELVEAVQRRGGKLPRGAPARVRKVAMSVFWVLSLSVAWWMLAGAHFNDREYYHEIFEYMFAIPIVGSLLVIIFLIRAGWIQNEYFCGEVEAMARRRFFLGIAAGLFGTVCWVPTEKLCETSKFFRTFPGHFLWHISMSWGMMNCLIYACMLRADNHQAYPRFKKGRGFVSRLYFLFYPAFVMEHRDWSPTMSNLRPEEAWSTQGSASTPEKGFCQTAVVPVGHSMEA